MYKLVSPNIIPRLAALMSGVPPSPSLNLGLGCGLVKALDSAKGRIRVYLTVMEMSWQFLLDHILPHAIGSNNWGTAWNWA